MASRIARCAAAREAGVWPVVLARISIVIRPVAGSTVASQSTRGESRSLRTDTHAVQRDRHVTLAWEIRSLPPRSLRSRTMRPPGAGHHTGSDALCTRRRYTA